MTPGFFEALGVEVARGRLFAADEYAGPARLAVLSHGAWQGVFGGDEEVLGRTIQLDREPYTVVGVFPAEFVPPENVVGRQVDVWSTFDADAPEHRENWGSWYLQILGRLAPEVSLEAAREELGALSERLVATNPAGFEDSLEPYRIRVTPLHAATVERYGSTLYLLLGAVGLMLLIACANVASLLLARGTERHREVAVRAALGASRRDIFRQLLVEALVLSMAGGALGVFGALGGVGIFNRFRPMAIPLADSVAVDWRVLIVALATSLLVGLVFGIAPAWRATRTDLNEAIRDGSGTLSASAGRQRLRSVLVVAEVAIAVILTVGAGLLFSSFVSLTSVDPGFDTEELLTFRLGFASRPAEERLPYVEQVLDSIRGVPGVDSGAVSITVPFQLTGDDRCCWFDQMVTDEDPQTRHMAVVNPVGDDYFEALRATLLYGRTIERGDREADPVAVVTAATAQQMFGREDVVGQILHVDGDLDLRIVGVVADIRHWGYSQDAVRQLYVPYRAFHQFFQHAAFVVRGEREDLGDAIRQAVWAVDAEQPIGRLDTMRSLVSESIAAPRFYSGVFGLFSVVALMLAAAGLYSVLMFQVGQRRRELGIRLALGARARSLVGLVVREGMVLTALGVAIGIGAALALGRLLESMLFGVTATDATTMVAVAAALMAVAFLACYVPARRAGRSDPLTTLRAE